MLLNSSLSLKEKIELFKINKKPRKQIILKFDTIKNGLVLPELDKMPNLRYTHFKNKKKHFTYNRNSNSQHLLNCRTSMEED